MFQKKRRFQRNEIDANIFLIMVIYGYFFISLAQLVGIFGGDRSPLQVRSEKRLSENYLKKSVDSGLDSMCILTSLVYLVDVVFSLINFKNA